MTTSDQARAALAQAQQLLEAVETDGRRLEFVEWLDEGGIAAQQDLVGCAYCIIEA